MAAIVAVLVDAYVRKAKRQDLGIRTRSIPTSTRTSFSSAATILNLVWWDTDKDFAK